MVPPFTRKNAPNLSTDRRPSLNVTPPVTPEKTPNSNSGGIPGGAAVGGGNEDIRKFLTKELAVDKVNGIHRHLWWAGRPGNNRPLHRQRMMLRNVVITEDPALHMVWFDSTIYIKPLPEYLLDWEFFNTHICSDEILFQLACGFLLSYSKLIFHKSDFKIAIDEGLIPNTIDWASWCSFALEIRNIPLIDVNKRYKYGELRLRRLNHIFNFCRWELAYHSVYTQYDHFFTQNFAWLLLVFGYLTLVLTAMQVILATPSTTKVFQDVSYWFGVFSIIAVLAGVLLVSGLFVILFIYNLIITLLWQHKCRLESRRARKRSTPGAA